MISVGRQQRSLFSRYARRAAGLLLVGAPLVACSSILGISSDPAVQALQPGSGTCSGTVYVRIASDFSGTATDIAIPYHFGVYDYLRKLNEGGGIRGCPIDVQVADNKYDPSTTQTVVDGWRASDPHWADVSALFIFGTGPTTRVAPSVMQEKKVIIAGSYAGSLASPTPVAKDVAYPVVNDQFQAASFPEHKESPGWPYIFFPATDYSTGIRLAIQAAWTIAPGRIAMAHDTQDKCLYCVDPLAAGKSFVGALQGMSVGRDLIIPQTSNAADEPTIDSAVQSYFEQEVNHVLADPTYQPVTWIWSGNSVMSTSLLGKAVAAAQQTINADTRLSNDVRSKWQLRVMANNWGIGETMPSICGPACNGIVYGLFPVPRYADLQNAGGMAALIALHDEFGNKDTNPPPPMKPRSVSDFRDVRYVQGYAAAVMWRKGMEAAIDAGHKNPTGEQLKTALEGFKLVDMDGLTAGPISFSATDHRPQSNEAVYQLDGKGQLTWVNKFSIELVPDWLGY